MHAHKHTPRRLVTLGIRQALAEALATALTEEQDADQALQELFGEDFGHDAIFGDHLTKKGEHSRARPAREGEARRGASNRCIHSGCTTFASFAPTSRIQHGDTAAQALGDGHRLRKPKAIHCAKHREEGEVDVKSIKCQAVGCSSRALCGDPATGEKVACGKHRAAHHVDLFNARCSFAQGCMRRATFGVSGQRPTLCSLHASAETGLVNRRARLCRWVCAAPDEERGAGQEGVERRGQRQCLKRAVYGDRAGRPVFCRVHKRQGDYLCDVKLCNFSGCQRQPSFGRPKGRVRFCSQHRPAGSVSLRRRQLQAASMGSD